MSNVFSLGARRQKKLDAEQSFKDQLVPPMGMSIQEEEEWYTQQMAEYRANEGRLRKERNRANKAVLRAYRIKN